MLINRKLFTTKISFRKATNQKKPTLPQRLFLPQISFKTHKSIGAADVHERCEPQFAGLAGIACAQKQTEVGVRGALFAPLFGHSKSGKEKKTHLA